MVQGDSYNEPPVHGGENIGQVGGENMTKVEELKEKFKEDLTEEDLKKIIEEIEKQGNEEAKYFLKLTIFSNKCHPDGPYKEKYSVLFGDIEEIHVNEISDTCSKYEDIIIIPKSRAVVILYYDGFGKPLNVYVFSFEKGWLSIPL